MKDQLKLDLFPIFDLNEINYEQNKISSDEWFHPFTIKYFDFNNDPSTIYHIENLLMHNTLVRKFWLLEALRSRKEGIKGHQYYNSLGYANEAKEHNLLFKNRLENFTLEFRTLKIDNIWELEI